MTRFEQVGVERQLESNSRNEAIAQFRRSCDACCRRGCFIRCDNCAIAAAHKEVVAGFEEQYVYRRLVLYYKREA